MAKYFVTGATGFIGGELVKQLVGRGHTVVALVRSPQKAAMLRALGVEMHAGDISDREVIVCDPMLATAHSAIAAVDRLKESGARRIKFICVLGSEQGARAFAEVHPDVPVFAAAIDAKLNDHGYIVPGLGDAGDRLFGTK